MSAPAFPCTWSNGSDLNATAPNGEVVPPNGVAYMYGLTKRELFAAMAMQGLTADPTDRGTYDDYAKDAVRCADALIAELAKERT